MKYRKEIDGLRTIAVLPVIFFHAGFEIFSGGYVGVDVFFVISGYLITTIILNEKEKGTFSILDFYDRRARRILPALFFVMSISLCAAWFILFPADMVDFSESLAAITIFSSNILFWSESGYWGVENELKPMLHTWSLAVEEQYYVFFPIFLACMWKFRRRWIFISFLIIAFISLLLSHWASSRFPTANFFLLPTRIWELAIGAGVAFYFVYKKTLIQTEKKGHLRSELMGFLGVFLIGYSIVMFDENTLFPSFYSLVPTIGAALIIVFSTHTTLTGKLLSLKPMVAIGLISYSAYLWHQPLFAFARHLQISEVSKTTYLLLSSMSLIFAYLSWQFIEAPFRKKGLFSRKQILTFSVAGSLFFILVGGAGYFTGGFKSRFNHELIEKTESAASSNFNLNLCEENIGKNHYCVLIPSDEKYLVIYGDSHAQAIAHEAKYLLKSTGLGVILISRNACPPVKGIYRKDQPNAEQCVEHNDDAYDFIINNSSIKFIVLASRWTLGLEGTRFDNFEGGVERGREAETDLVVGGEYLNHFDQNKRNSLVADAYENSIKKLVETGKKLVIIYPTPEAGWSVPEKLRLQYRSVKDVEFHPKDASTSYARYLERNERTKSVLDRLEHFDNYYKVEPEDLLCNTVVVDRCIAVKDGNILYKDDDHLSDAGARLVIEELVSLIKQTQG